MKIEEIIKEAGCWHQLLAPELNKRGRNESYDDMAVRASLEHLRLHKSPEVYEFYKHIYDVEGEINGI